MSNDVVRFGLLAAYALASVAGMSLLKSAESVLSFRCVFGFALYMASFLVWIGLILRMMPLSQAFPLAAGALMIGTQLAGWLLLKEKIGFQQISGVSLIMAGVFLVNATSGARA